MAEFSVKPSLTIVQAPKTESDVDKYLLKHGRCPECKMQTHEVRKSMFKKALVPLTNDNVFNGRCLICHPIDGKARKASDYRNGPEVSSSDASIDALSGKASAVLQPQSNFSWNDEQFDESYWHNTNLAKYKHHHQSSIASTKASKNNTADHEIAVLPSDGAIHDSSWLNIDENKTTDHQTASSTSSIPEWLNIDAPPSAVLSHSGNSHSSKTTSQMTSVHVPETSFGLSKQGSSGTASKRRYSDGVYEGSLSSGGHRSGYGIMSYDNGDVHEGEWKHDMKAGRGKFTDAEGNIAEGTWDNDRMNGFGAFHLVNGCEFVGQIKNGTWSGKGRYTSAEGDIYTGTFKDGEFHGWGTMCYTEGNSFTGDWVCGIRDGKGVFKWSDGEVDLCAYAGHDRDGQGVRYSADGKTAWELVDGDLTQEITIEESRQIAQNLGLEVPENVPLTPPHVPDVHDLSEEAPGKAHSSASASCTPKSKGYTHPYLRRKFKSVGKPDLDSSGEDGIPSKIKEKAFAEGSYRGHLNECDQREGQGTMTYSDSSAQYVGNWRADLRHGKGSCRWPDGSSYNGEWVDDEMSGHGTHIYKNGDSYEGEFFGSARHGRGIYRSATGYVSVMCYNENIPAGHGARWSADGTKAFGLKDGRILERISFEEADLIAKQVGLAVPVTIKSTPSQLDESRSCGSNDNSVREAHQPSDLESNRANDNYNKGRVTFRMGMYEGELNDRGEREGRGIMRYNSGAQFDGQWVANKKKLGFNRSSGGNIYVGEFRSHQKFGDGAEWSANRKKVWHVINGVKQEEVDIDKAREIVGRLGLDVPKQQ